MSENSSEFLKRTCLICGCHTNQTINIYEPRSGPNIVQLIQAKFKFQPLNEDKYLCFSCNNWLINWHSLQALNSNDAESPSGTFRSHLNSGNVVEEAKNSGSGPGAQKLQTIRRPIAYVKPRVVQQSRAESAEVTTADMSADIANESELAEQQQQQHQQQQQDENEEEIAEFEGAAEFDICMLQRKMNFNKRNFRPQLSRCGRRHHRGMQQCSCGRCVVQRSGINTHQPKFPTCRKCRKQTRLDAQYGRSVAQVERELARREPPLLNNSVGNDAHVPLPPPLRNQSRPQPRVAHGFSFLPRPSLDGRVVARLRRLGTMLSRESERTQSGSNAMQRPPQWSRPLADDEVLLNFESSVSEVLHSLPSDRFADIRSLSVAAEINHRDQVSSANTVAAVVAEVIDLCEPDDSAQEAQPKTGNSSEGESDSDSESETEDSELLNPCGILQGFSLPKGLSITRN